MKSRIARTLAMTVLAAFLFGLVSKDAVPPVHAQNSARHARYIVIDLGTLGGTSSGGSGINNEGWVTSKFAIA